MSLDTTVYTALNSAGVDPLVRGWLPEGQTFPCAVVRYISDRPMNTLNGEMAMKNEIIGIDCWAATLEEAEALRDQIKSAMAASNLVAVRQALRTLHEPETKTFRFTLEYSVRGL
ncbi:tail completion protein gp17 [Neptuniibacter pectenicola]|uniref:tail completion protein gp17 n=1 Tax=Neptuniibacter pectenicola TaxID=1806669 RepID=UPI0007963315|nr:DUF3168 domain-containing protein [Neptuniibacter pectenicola]KXJ57188.1 MAG: hypothetical protein AXW15_13715 [Neptuniibacter sp. Phe_28]